MVFTQQQNDSIIEHLLLNVFALTDTSDLYTCLTDGQLPDTFTDWLLCLQDNDILTDLKVTKTDGSGNDYEAPMSLVDQKRALMYGRFLQYRDTEKGRALNTQEWLAVTHDEFHWFTLNPISPPPISSSTTTSSTTSTTSSSATS